MSDTYAPPPGGVANALARARLGVWPVVFIVIAAAAPATVVFGGAPAGYATTGVRGLPLAYLVVAAVLAVFSIGYVAMSRKIINAGAFYSYVTHGLGRPAGVSAAFVAVLSYTVMPAGLLGGLGVAANSFVAQHLGIPAAPWWVWAVLALAAITLLSVLRIDLNGTVLAIMLLAEVAITVLFAVVQVAHPFGGTVTYDTLQPANLIGNGVGAALVTAIAGFVGFESTAVYNEEAHNPRKTIPRATYWAIAVIGVLYAFCAWAMSVATGPANIVPRATQELSALPFNLVRPYLNPAFVTFGELLLLTSLGAAALAFMNAGARYWYALGREGVFFRWLARIWAKTAAPAAGAVVQSAIVLAIIVLYVINGWDPFTRMFFVLTVLGGFGVLILMTATSVAVVAFFSRRRNHYDVGIGRGTIAPTVAAGILAAILIATLAQFATLLGVDPASPLRWQLPAMFAIAAAAGLIWAFVLRAVRPQAYLRIGRGATQPTDARTPVGAR